MRTEQRYGSYTERYRGLSRLARAVIEMRTQGNVPRGTIEDKPIDKGKSDE